MSDEVSTHHRGKHRQTRWEFIFAIAAVAAVAAAFAPAAPTGIDVFDVLERALFAAIVTLFAANSRRWTWLILAGTATALAGSIWVFLLGLVALGFAVHAAVRTNRRDRTTGALIGALSIQALLRTTDVGFFGFTALATGVVVTIVLVSGYRTMRSRNRRRVRIASGVLFVFVVLSSLGFAITALRAKSPIDGGIHLAQLGLDSAMQAHQGAAATNWAASNRFFVQARNILDNPLSKTAYAIPVLSQHAQLATTAAGSGADITATAARAASVAPYRTLRAADGTFDLKQIATMEQPVAKTAASMTRARTDLDAVTNPWLVDKVRGQVGNYRDQLDRAIPEARRALGALRAAPELLGGNGTRRYLLLFANPAEARGMGGFIGAWAELDATNGHLELVRSGKMGELNDATDPNSRKITGEPEYLRRYGYLQPARYLQNISASPDFPTVARVAEQLYPQVGGHKVDGVMYIDPIALASLLKLTGPVKAEGIPMPLTSKNAADFLMHGQYIEFPGTTDRSDLLSNAARATFDALTHRSLPSVSTITDTLSPMVRDRRLLASVTDQTSDRYLSSVGLTGKFPRPGDTDLLSVRVSNGSANKVDYYLHQLTGYEVGHDPKTGQTRATVDLRLTNDAPAGGQPSYVLGNPDTRSGNTNGEPFGSEDVQFSVYSPLHPQSMVIDGKKVGIQVERELGYWVATQTVNVPPGGRVTISLDLSGKIDVGKSYPLTVVPQATANVGATLVRVRNGTDLSGPSDVGNSRVLKGAQVQRILIPLPPGSTSR